MTHEAFLRMSVLNALVEIRRARANNPNFDLRTAQSTLIVSGVSEASFDYDVALALIEKYPQLGEPSFEEQPLIIRQALSEIIIAERPSWMSAILYGRHVLMDSLQSDNALQCFASAGLLDNDPTAWDWWDRLGAKVRGQRDELKLRSGRAGEELSLSFERRRLAEEGIGDLEPTWDSRDNDTLGYDIRSYVRRDGDVHPLLIEAKAASDLPLIFHLSPGEWKVAQSRPNSYLFYVWHLPSERLTIITPEELREHVPTNVGRGQWESIRITWPIRNEPDLPCNP